MNSHYGEEFQEGNDHKILFRYFKFIYITWPGQIPNQSKTALINHSQQSIQQDQGSQVAPPGCKISLHHSTVSIEPNFATFSAKKTLVETIIYNLNWPNNGSDKAPI